MHNPQVDKTWLERDLRRYLGREAAPRELWDRVVLPREQSRPRASRRVGWMLLATSAMTASVLAMAWGYQGDRLEFKNDRASEIRKWVATRTGVDIPLLAQPASCIEMTGARVLAGNFRSKDDAGVEVRYRVAGRDTALTVTDSATPSRHPDHKSLTASSMQGIATVSWAMAGRDYTLAASTQEDLRNACFVCHVEMPVTWN